MDGKEAKRHVLLVEDLKEYWKPSREALESLGYEVLIAEDGAEAIQALQKSLPDLLIVDIMLPKVHGIQVVQAVRSFPEGEGVGVIVCSASQFRAEITHLEELDIYAFLSKPYNIQDLLRQVSKYFEGEVQGEHLLKKVDPSSKVFVPDKNIDRYLQLWGSRGSIPVCHSNFTHYGGNTSCFSITAGDSVLIFDAGTGIRELGLQLIRSGVKKAHLFITHTHWDHIQGFPFFAPAYIPGFELEVYGAKGLGMGLESIFRKQLDRDFFPVQLEEMRGSIRFHLLKEKIEIDGCSVSCELVNHPGATLAYKVKVGGSIVVWMPDNEFLQGYLGSPFALKHDSPEVLPYRREMNFLRGADILVSEAQYMNEEYPSKIGWGHTSLSNACLLAKLSGVRRWIVTHHDPAHDDGFIHEKSIMTKDLLNQLDFPVRLVYGHDGLVETF